MKKLCIVVGLMVGGLHGAGASNEFVVKKKKKEPSTAALKESCCRLSGDIMAAIPGVLTAVADVQTLCLEMVCGALEGDAESFCERASKKELAASLETLEKIHERLCTMQHEISESGARLRAHIAKK